MWVVRWNHSGDPAVNPEQHNPVELTSVPRRDPATGGLRAGVAEDFPNGGGNRAFLFVVDGPAGRYSWFFQNSASAVDLHLPIVIDGKDYGAPTRQPEGRDEGRRSRVCGPLDRIWRQRDRAGGPAGALPEGLPPVHWDGLCSPFAAGVPQPYSDPALEARLTTAGVALLKPVQYMDKWRIDRQGVRAVENTAVKRALGF